jgi:hypothetical protein
MKKDLIRLFLCIVFLFLLAVIYAQAQNAALREADVQGIMRTTVEFNYDYMTRNNIDWNDYVNQLKDYNNKLRRLDRHYLPQCERIKPNNTSANAEEANAEK